MIDLRAAVARQLKQVRIKSTDGRTVLIEALKPTTKVLEIKKTIAERKFFKAEEGFLSVDAKNPVCEVWLKTSLALVGIFCFSRESIALFPLSSARVLQLIYSSVFNASFGVPLDDEKTLG